MNVSVLLLLAEGFEEIEASTVLDLLRRAGVEVVTANVSGGDLVRGAHGLAVKADRNLAEVRDRVFSAVVLPGGMPGSTNLAESADVEHVLKAHAAQGTYVAAICAAPIVLAKYGLLKGRKATCYPGCEAQLTGARIQDEAVVEDGQVITSRGPATAMDFGLTLIEKLVGAAKSREIRRAVLACDKRNL